MFKRFFKENSPFFVLYTLFLIAGGVLLATIEQGDCIRYFSEHRTDSGEFFFTWFTKVGEGYFYALGLLIALFIRFRLAFMIPLTGVLVLIVSQPLKFYFKHPRPKNYFTGIEEFKELDIVEGVFLNAGYTSFPSGHTMSAFALFSFLAFMVKGKWWGLVFFFTALLVGVSRMYLVQHFLKDIYLGGLLGVLCAAGLFLFQQRWAVDETKWYDRSLRKKQPVA